MISATLIFLTGCGRESHSAEAVQDDSLYADTSVILFGPSLTEIFYLSGAFWRVAAVDRYSTWPSQASELPVAGDFLSPSLELITSLGATSIHVVGTNQSLLDIAERLGIPYYQYSFDSLDDVFESCSRVEHLYPEADLTAFSGEIEQTMDSLSLLFSADSPEVMIVVYLKGDGAITLAGKDTFYFDILNGCGCTLAAPETGSYPSVSVEGILSIAPDRVIILDPYEAGETLLRSWRSNGLDDSNVAILSGDHVLIPGARLRELIVGIAQCLN